MPERSQPSEAMMQHIGRLLVPETDWKSKISSWLLPVYHTITDETVNRIGVWRRRYMLKSWRVGVYQPVIARTRHPKLIINRFNKQGGDLAKSANAIRKLNHMKNTRKEKK